MRLYSDEEATRGVPHVRGNMTVAAQRVRQHRAVSRKKQHHHHQGVLALPAGRVETLTRQGRVYIGPEQNVKKPPRSSPPWPVHDETEKGEVTSLKEGQDVQRVHVAFGVRSVVAEVTMSAMVKPREGDC